MVNEIKKDGVRVNKFISDSGFCSRREADAFIQAGRVLINRKVAGLGDLVVEGATVEVDGERVGHKTRKAVYIALNKPVGVTSTTDKADPTNIVDFVGYKERIFHIGRLDKDSEGLIFLTNDGDIVNKILRARNNHVKEYVVWVNRQITPEFLKKMGGGVDIGDAVTQPCKIVKRTEDCFTIFLTQGLNRQIRRMCEVLGYRVTRLKRVAIMNVTLGNLAVGRWRYFTPQEVQEMHALLENSTGVADVSSVDSDNKRVDFKKIGSGRQSSKTATRGSSTSTYSDYKKGNFRRKR